MEYMLEVFFDGSVDERFMTLGGMAATDQIWRQLEADWNRVLSERGNPTRLHMTNAMTLNGEFSQWEGEDRDYLVDGLLNVLLSFRKNPHIRAFSCTIDLAAHRDASKRKALPVPERLCARLTVPAVLKWYEATNIPIVAPVSMWFDVNEPFLRHVDADWRNKKIRSRDRMLEFINHLSPLDDSRSVGLQVADVIAWGANRTASHFGVEDPWRSDRLYTTVVKACNTLDRSWRFLGLDELLEGDFSEWGSILSDPQRRKFGQDRFERRALVRSTPMK